MGKLIDGGGRFYTFGGQHVHEVGPGTPETHLCRRVADFPAGVAPAAAMLGRCKACGALVAHDGRFPTVPLLCLQCGGVDPLPIE